MLNFRDPSDIVYLYNERARNKLFKLHPWQTRLHKQFADPEFDYTTKVNRINVVANNGSGKSSTIIGPCGMWTAMTYKMSRTVITSSSGKQMDTQLNSVLNLMCTQVNLMHGTQGAKWEIKYRDFKFIPDPARPDIYSKIELYATDEPGKAEGYHPIEDGAMFVFITDEGKSISDEIFQAIERCNGKSHWLNVSSPGKPRGYFYNACTSGLWRTTKITYRDCPHIKDDEVNAARESFGEQSAFFRSSYLAEFTDVNETVVIPYDKLLRQLRQPPLEIQDGRRRAGVDLSGGGDENVVSVWQGNKQIGLETFQISDLRQSVPFLVNIFRKYDLKGENIFIDDGYVGRAIIDYLRDEKYEVVSVRFGGSPFNKVAYANRGTELWFNFERHLEHLIFIDHAKCRKQLASRYYKQADKTNKIQLESKREARAQGHGSPDYGDATVLAFADLPLGYFVGGGLRIEESPADKLNQKFKKLLQNNCEADVTPEELGDITEYYRKIKRDRAPKEGEGSVQYNVSRMTGDRSYSALHALLETEQEKRRL